eukprot:scaffold501_cov355-Pinguiococcus_pyrenoidosus.AAC.14
MLGCTRRAISPRQTLRCLRGLAVVDRRSSGPSRGSPGRAARNPQKLRRTARGTGLERALSRSSALDCASGFGMGSACPSRPFGEVAGDCSHAFAQESLPHGSLLPHLPAPWACWPRSSPSAHSAAAEQPAPRRYLLPWRSLAPLELVELPSLHLGRRLERSRTIVPRPGRCPLPETAAIWPWRCPLPVGGASLHCPAAVCRHQWKRPFRLGFAALPRSESFPGGVVAAADRSLQEARSKKQEARSKKQ